MTVFNSETGNVIWQKNDNENRVQKSMALSADSQLVYAKTMQGEVIGVSTSADSMQIVWKANTNLNYEIAPIAIVEYDNIIYVPSNSGLVIAVNRDSSILWKHKISNALVTNITPVSKNKIIVTTMDGKVVCLSYNP